MMKISFAWDIPKSNINYEKHGVSFEEAQSVFLDEKAIEYFDKEYSDQEDRFLMLGLSNKFRLLLISYTVKKHNSSIIIRLISARKATKKESKNYMGK
jgi:uncharacterized DUF497 family protein